MAPALLDGTDYLFHEWAYKAAGFVSYGGISGGNALGAVVEATARPTQSSGTPDAVTITFLSQ